MDPKNYNQIKTIDEVIEEVKVNSPEGNGVVSANIKNLPFSGNIRIVDDCKILNVDILGFYMCLNYTNGCIQYNKENFSKDRMKFDVVDDHQLVWDINGDWKTTINSAGALNVEAEFIANIPLLINVEGLTPEYTLNLIFSSKAQENQCKSVIKMPMINLSFV